MLLNDTIVAVSSATAPAARMIVRAGGPGAFDLLRVLGCEQFLPGFAQRSPIAFGRFTLPAWIYTFAAPHSYTGQDIVEWHIPGNPLLAKLLLGFLIKNGARLAEPGEFTARAYFNGKIDLSQAEGVAAAISAANAPQLAAARRLLAAELARRLRPSMDRLAESLGLVEVGIDFSEEDVQFVSTPQLTDRISTVMGDLQTLRTQSPQLQRNAHQPVIVLAGRPNAGKSTLLNVLSGQNRSVVSHFAGTTRDLLSAEVKLARGLVRLIDTAGLEMTNEAADSIADQMRKQARRAIGECDILILLHDCNDPLPAMNMQRSPDMILITKADLLDSIPPSNGSLFISAATGLNLESLTHRLDELAFGPDAPTASPALTARHLQALDEALTRLHQALQRVKEGTPELVAADLREALDALGQILGVLTPDDILGRIFSTFCIGK